MDLCTLTGRRGARWLGWALLLQALFCTLGVSAQERPPQASAPGAARVGGAAGAGGTVGVSDATAEPAPGETTFTLLGAPPGAEVKIDGQLVGVTPLPPRTPVGPGPHQLQVTRRAYSSYTREFTAYAGRMVALEITLLPTHMLVHLRVSEAGAQVFVDDELRGEAPLELELAPGIHQLTIRGPNIQDETFPLTAVVGEELEREVLVKLKPEQRRKEQAARPKERRFYTRWWVWTLASVGAIGIATAIIVPTLLAQRSSCEKLGGEVCFPIDLTTPTLHSALVVRF